VVRRFVRFQLGEKLPDETQVSESDA